MIQLRHQQVVFEDAIRNAFRQHRCVIGVAPTGFGKSIVCADMALKAVRDRNRRVLVVTNRRQIVRQLAEACSAVGIHTGIIMGDEPADEDAPLQVASIQTLKRREFSGVRTPGFIIVDECHQMAQAYATMLTERFCNTPALGLTATPVGPGGSRIGHFDTVVEPIRNTEVIEAGDLLKVHPYLAPSEPDLGGIDLKRVSQNELGERVESCTVYGNVFDLWEPYQHMQTMVVLPSRATCNQFLKIATSRGITAKIVDGTTPQVERTGTFSEFKSLDCQMLLGVDVVREGLDLPIAQCLIDLQPTHQFRVYWQKLGRVKRPHPGQESSVVIDLAGNLWRHMVHPDQDPPWEDVTNDKTIEEVNERKAGVRCPECGSKDYYGPNGGLYKCEDCGHTWAQKKPWVCPHCKQGLAPWQKVIGGVCPNCSQKVTTKPVRTIRMEDGSFRTVPAEEVKRRKKSKADSEAAAWESLVWTAVHFNTKPPKPGQKKKEMTLNTCRGIFKNTHGHWPRPGLKFRPEDGSGDWGRTPNAAYNLKPRRKAKA